jgi:hypothetical protein
VSELQALANSGESMLATASVSGELLGEPSTEPQRTWPTARSVSSHLSSRCRHARRAPALRFRSSGGHSYNTKCELYAILHLEVC